MSNVFKLYSTEDTNSYSESLRLKTFLSRAHLLFFRSLTFSYTFFTTVLDI